MAKLKAQGSYKITPVAQSNENTCWLACYQMIYQAQDWDKATLLERLKTAGIDTTATLKDADQEKAGKAVGFTSDCSSVLTDFATVRKYMESYGPFKVSISVGDSGHAIVVTAVDPDDESVYFINPWSELWTAERAADVKERSYSFKSLRTDLQNRRTVKGSLQYYTANF
jgi:hypothetical protein